MAIYLYKAVARSGAVQAGELESVSPEACVQELLRTGATPLEVRAKSHWIPVWLQRPVGLGAKPGAREILELTQDMGTLLRAGLNPDRALSVVAGVTDRAVMRVVPSACPRHVSR